MVKQSRKKKQDADLDLEINEYEPSESDDEYNDTERLMLKQAAKRRSKQADDSDESEEEVLGVHESEDEDEDDVDVGEPLGEEMDSDIEGKDDDDHLPDSKAWGSKKKSYYNTDYVDQDYGGFSKAEEEEAALLEEQEARAIQNRLIAELDEADVSLGILPAKNSEVNKKGASFEDDDFSEIIKTDVSKLSKREKLALLEKESPEFSGLVSDFKERMTYAKDNLEPILNMVDSGEIPQCQAVKFISTKYHLILNYCTNIAFYLLLKSKRSRVKTHPVIKRLVQFRKLLDEMDPIDEEIIQPQVKEILKIKRKGKELNIIHSPVQPPPVITGNRAERRRKLQLLKEEEDSRNAKKPKIESFEDIQLHENEPESEEEEEGDEDTEKRGITYEIAKNKGLTPKRKKENRNPRVKNKNKFRKATVRRKGQVRGVYKEIKRYDGEPFGIKASVSKSVKLK
ncbi:something about silencing protein 10-like [Macrosteles quadrilineatus]|uniref:something about silencing protein 10-like n=1 Tax=Macrosteles quadrilineatus TaxID=74068 RepID=UPI0023E2C712|nr:something about silencing protein 10-like [Macrosteles quadrilineatus]